MKTAKAVCTPKETVFSLSKADTVANISDLILNKIDAAKFFEQNHVTAGMRTLLVQVFDRVSGSSPQGVFRLKQAMGGGKTHNLIATGLLAHDPVLRSKVMAEIGRAVSESPVRLAAFDGRQTDKKDYLWADIFQQLGVLDRWKGGQRAPGSDTWSDVIGTEPTIIMLDEMPPYMEALAMTQAGATETEADRTVIGLSNLMVAIADGKLPHCALIISDLTSNWKRGSESLSHAFESALKNLNDEASRVCADIQPVRLDGNEIYAILRKRLFDNTADETEIAEVAAVYDQCYSVAIQQGVMREGDRRWAARIPDTYPFHPGLEDLIARFRENPGFQQTREIIRIAKALVRSAWSMPEEPYLLHPHFLDFGDPETDSLLDQINSSLQNARSHDIWKNGGGAAAEEYAKRRGVPLLLDAAKLIYLASLSAATHATLGLRADEVAAYLCAPGREVAMVTRLLLTELEDNTEYLHPRTDERWYFRDTKNLNSAIKDRAAMIRDEERLKELKIHLQALFKPGSTAKGNFVYQKLMVFPAIDDLEVDGKQIVLVVARPTEDGLDEHFLKFWETQTYRNRLLFLSGATTFNNVLDSVAVLKAIKDLIKEFEEEGKSKTSAEFLQADKTQTRFTTNFRSALRETFTALYYPYEAELRPASLRFEFASNKFDAEQTICETLKQEAKYREDTADASFIQEFEDEIFKPSSRPWADMLEQTARDPNWYWYRPGALDEVKQNALLHGRWRDDGPGRVKRGPFPKEKTSVIPHKRDRNPDTGEATLEVEVKFGDRIHYESGDSEVTESSPLLQNGQLKTKDMRVSFLAVDSSGSHETGEPFNWTNELTLKHKTDYRDGRYRLTLQSVPEGATIRYTTNGANPRTGAVYAGPVELPADTLKIQAYAEKQGVESKYLQLDPPKAGAEGSEDEPTIDPDLAATWAHRVRCETRKASFDALLCFQKFSAELSGIRAVFSDVSDADRWYEITTGDRVLLGAAELEQILGSVPESLSAGAEVSLTVKGVRCAKGSQLIELARELGEPLTKGEVSQ